MGEHLIDGEFQSDKYPTCPRGKVPLSCKDPMAQDLLWEYAQRRRNIDEGFASDLEVALLSAGFIRSCLNQSALSELEWLAKQPGPVWGGTLERNDPITDPQMQKWIADGLIKAVTRPRLGYVITPKGLLILKSKGRMP